MCEAKPIKLKGEIDKFTIIVRDFNILLSTIDSTPRQKISKDIREQHHQPTGSNQHL